MSIREWNEIVDLVGSDKIKERTDGVSRFQAFLTITRHHQLLSKERSHSWLKTLQALFHLVITERNLSVSKPTATVAKRLEDSTNLVRWTVERVHTELSRKAVRAVLAHLVQMVAHSGKLQSFAITYLRTLRHLLQHPPHLEHLDESQWTDIVSLCFAGVLGDKIKVGTEFKDDEAMDIDEDYVGVIGALRETDEDAVDRPQRRTATREDIELVGCIEAAFRSKSAPFHAYSRIIFTKFNRLFRQFPDETTAHLPALTALNRAFAELDLNDQKTMRDVGTQLWPHVVSLWLTKSPALKEQVVMALTYLDPFVSPDPHASHEPHALVVELKVRPLFESVMKEPTTRWREDSLLDLDNLRLGLDGEQPPAPFSWATVRHGHEFDAKDAVAWMILQLGASSLVKLYVYSEGALPVVDPATPDGTNPAKRRKIEEPLAHFVDQLRETEAASITVFRLQILVFLVEAHWHRLHLDLCQRLLRTATALLSHEGLQIQNWAFMVIAAIASRPFDGSSLSTVSGSPRSRRDKAAPHWDQVWSLALRRLSNPSVCRTACHTANVLLSKSLASTALVTSSLEAFARDLDVQGPNFPSDAVCSFLRHALTLTVADVRLSRLRLPEKIFAWVSTAWRPLDGIIRVHSIGRARPKADPLDAAALARLVASLCGVDNPATLPTDFPLPDTPVATMAIEIAETYNIREYIVGRVPAYRGYDASARPGKDSKANSGGLAVSDGLERRISVWLERILDDLCTKDGESHGEAYWTGLNVDMARRHLDLATLALVVDAVFEQHKIQKSDRKTVKAACVVLGHLAPTLSLSKWQPGERATFLDGLSPLFIPLRPDPPVEYPVLLDPGAASDIPAHLIPPIQDDHWHADRFEYDSPAFALLRTIWSRDHVLDVLNTITASLQKILTGVVEGPPPPTPTPAGTQVQASQSQRGGQEDDFGEIKVGKSLTMTRATATLSSERAESSCVASCLRGLISLAMASAKSSGAVRVPELIQAIIEADGDDGIVIAEHAFNAVRQGILSFGLATAEQVLDHLGSVLLPEYRYARDERFALAALRFLECTMHLWVDPPADGDEFASDARTLVGWFTRQLVEDKLRAWRVRVRCTAFLDSYLVVDVSQAKWDPGCVGLTAETGEAILPTSLLPTRLNDPDFRVRFRAASSVAKLYTVLYTNGIDSDDMHSELKKSLAMNTNLDETERWLTLFICHANILIASGERRRHSWVHIVVAVAQELVYAPQVDALLDGAADRLGFAGGRRGLFMPYRKFLANNRQASIQRGEYAEDRPVAFNACGFASLTEMRRADLREHGSVVLATGNFDAFATLCNVVQMSEEAVALECLPQTLADVVLEVDLAVTTTEQLQTLVMRLAYRSGAKDETVAKALLKSVADEAVAFMFAALWESSWTQQGPHPLDSTKLAASFRSILSTGSSINLYHPPLVSSRAERVIKNVKLFAKEYGGFRSAHTIYAVVRQLLARIEHAPFVDLARCGVVSLSAALALAGKAAQLPVTLGAIAESLIPLLGRSELVPYLASILRWAFREWLSLLKVDQRSLPDLCENLVRATVEVKSVMDSPTSEEAFNTVNALGKFLGDVLNGARPFAADEVMVASLLWPLPLVDPAEYPLSDLQESLASPFAPIPKFSLVKIFRERPNVDESEKHATIWRLLDAMAPGKVPALDASLAMADLLYQRSGKIVEPTLEDRSAQSIRDLGPSLIDEAGIKRVVVKELLSVMHTGAPALVQLAFNSLRLVFGLAPPDQLYSSDELPARDFGVAEFLAHPSLRRAHGKRTRQARRIAELAEDHWVTHGASFEVWITDFAELLADVRAAGEPFYSQLVPVVHHSPAVAATIALHLVHSILLQEAKQTLDGAVRTALSSYFTRLLEDAQTNHRTLDAVVNIVIYLRQHPRPTEIATLEDRDHWLDVSWTLLADGAVKTGKPFAGLLFLELAHEYNALFRGADSKLDQLAQSLLYEIYAAVDEPDGFYGRESSDVREALSRRYRHEGRWSDALGHYGAEFENPADHLGAPPASRAHVGVVQSLAHSGFNRLAMSILQPARAEGRVRDDDVPEGLSYDLAWRTDCWDIPVEARAVGTSDVAVYNALRAVNAARDHSGLAQLVDHALVAETYKLSFVGLNSPTPPDAAVSAILSLREVRRWADLDNGENLDLAFATRLSNISSDFKFEHAERILSTRISLLRSIRRAEQVDQIGEFASPLYVQATKTERTCLLKLSATARAAGKLQASVNAVGLAHKLADGHTNADDVKEEFAHVLWDQGEHTSAISLLKSVRLKENRRAIVFAQLGEWTSEARVTNPRETLDTWFEPAVASLSKAQTSEDIGRVHAAYAAFADTQYQECFKISDAMETRFKQYAARKNTELEDINRRLAVAKAVPEGSQDKTLMSMLNLAQRDGENYLQEDRQLVDAALETTTLMLKTALDQFGKALNVSNAHDDLVFRFCALWLAPSNDEAIQTALVPLLAAIPTHKFVFLAHQLSARLTSPATTPFAKNIADVVTRLGCDHPFHALFPVQALRGVPPPALAKPRSRRSSTAPAQTQTETASQLIRAAAAEEVFAKVRKAAPHLNPRLDDFEYACRAYQEWAAFDLKKEESYSIGSGHNRRARPGKLQIKPTLLIRSGVVNLSIPVSTFDLPIDPQGKYPAKSFPAIVKYDSTFTTAGGIHTPKICLCEGDDGKKYRQLFKGEDDIRQDAVMEQAFSLVNSLFARDDRARRRKLAIRTYKVIPLQAKTGVIEFVANTQTLHETLVPSYKKYWPTITIGEARARLAPFEPKPGQGPANYPAKIAAFKKLLKEFPPIMRQVMHRVHKAPSLWFDMRLNYSRSVATTSIVGHIVGLGDRHLNNLLVDQVRGDLVMIDLGIAFDQGKRLAIPETVPFRLTQNIVDGFGMTGVEGVFRRCCEETLRVLRDRSSVVMTVLEVFKHDPLQTWAVSVEMAKRAQGDGSDDAKLDSLSELPDDADRALAIVRGKLDKSLSVPYTVNQLIAEATDVRNLGSIYSGWQAYV